MAPTIRFAIFPSFQWRMKNSSALVEVPKKLDTFGWQGIRPRRPRVAACLIYEQTCPVGGNTLAAIRQDLFEKTHAFLRIVRKTAHRKHGLCQLTLRKLPAQDCKQVSGFRALAALQ
ncbi:MAG TPA: hypothetical protein VLC92_06525 [Rhodocyclaceae bacterium]|nr:hypothetical protein [Rhodocyclaceae bacterium]